MDCIVHGSQRVRHDCVTFTLSLAAEDEGRHMKKIAILLERWERGVDVGRQNSIQYSLFISSCYIF